MKVAAQRMWYKEVFIGGWTGSEHTRRDTFPNFVEETGTNGNKVRIEKVRFVNTCFFRGVYCKESLNRGISAGC